MLLFLASFLVAAHANPIQKVIAMLDDLEAKIIREGEVAQKNFNEFSEFCDDHSKNLGHEIETAKNEVADLKAKIEEETSTIASLTNKIEKLGSEISTDQGDLKA